MRAGSSTKSSYLTTQGLPASPSEQFRAVELPDGEGHVERPAVSFTY